MIFLFLAASFPYPTIHTSCKYPYGGSGGMYPSMYLESFFSPSAVSWFSSLSKYSTGKRLLTASID